MRKCIFVLLLSCFSCYNILYLMGGANDGNQLQQAMETID